MSEASAKMHLRDYVRGDDIDLAIQVMVGSFVSAQKSSIKKQLERGFRFVPSSLDRDGLEEVQRLTMLLCRKYLRVATDHEEVLAFLLGQLVKDKVRYQTLRDSASPASVTIRVSELEERVRLLNFNSLARR